MFIINIEDINKDYLFICDKYMANIIMQNNIPLLGIKDNKYYFMNNDKLQNIILKGGEHKSE